MRVLALLALLSVCAASAELPPNPQQAAGAAVEQAVKKRNLQDLASYQANADGSVLIRFDAAISADDYNQTLAELRANPAIRGLRVEQIGLPGCVPCQSGEAGSNSKPAPSTPESPVPGK
jgi:hypothetical protein